MPYAACMFKIDRDRDGDGHSGGRDEPALSLSKAQKL